jgi:hypothetical protein
LAGSAEGKLVAQIAEEFGDGEQHRFVLTASPDAPAFIVKGIHRIMDSQPTQLLDDLIPDLPGVKYLEQVDEPLIVL